MKDRVTLTLDPAVIQRAKRLAHARHASVSGLVEDFLRTAPISGEHEGKSFASSWAGRFEIAENPKHDPLREALQIKYGLKKQ